MPRRTSTASMYRWHGEIRFVTDISLSLVRVDLASISKSTSHLPATFSEVTLTLTAPFILSLPHRRLNSPFERVFTREIPRHLAQQPRRHLSYFLLPLRGLTSRNPTSARFTRAQRASVSPVIDTREQQRVSFVPGTCRTTMSSLTWTTRDRWNTERSSRWSDRVWCPSGSRRR